MIGLVVGVIVAILWLRKFLYDRWEDDSEFWVNMATLIPSLVNAVQILIFNQIYSALAYHLTNYENHKTQTRYERSLILKTYIFQFLNSFNILFYIAFAKRSVTGCIMEVNGSTVKSEDLLCTDELMQQMRSIMIVAIIKNIMEIGLPCIIMLIKRRKNKKLFDTSRHHREDDKLLVRIEE